MEANLDREFEAIVDRGVAEPDREFEAIVDRTLAEFERDGEPNQYAEPADYRGGKAFLKMYNMGNHLWNSYDSFDAIFPTKETLFERLARIHKRMEILKIGPEVYGTTIRGDNLFILMEYLPRRPNYKNAEMMDLARDFVGRMHGEGYVHGDLVGNLMVNAAGELRAIDFESMFELGEADTPLVREWASDWTGRAPDEAVAAMIADERKVMY